MIGHVGNRNEPSFRRVIVIGGAGVAEIADESRHSARNRQRRGVTEPLQQVIINRSGHA